MDNDQIETSLDFPETVDLEGKTEDDQPIAGGETLVLVLIAHPLQRFLGRRQHLTPGTSITVGRSPDCEIDLPDVPLMSRVHAKIVWDDDGIWVEDQGSTNGTFVNREKVEERRYLDNGDRIQCGGVHFKFLRELDVEAAYYETLHQLALQDSLTEIANKRLFDEELNREFARARRHHRRLSLILFDVDDFKRINDKHGHLCGDFVLQQIAVIGRREMRREELLGRVGGDEFGILSPEVDAEGATVLAERLRQAIAETRLSAEIFESPLQVTCSFGVAELMPQMTTAEAFYSAADKALYESKNEGRNLVSTHGN